jgi:hypothetical protein
MFAACLASAAVSVRWLPKPWSWAIAAFTTALGLFSLLSRESKPAFVAALKGLRWKRSQFCRGWLITGDTGSGKTSSASTNLRTRSSATTALGRLCIDEKGVYWETLRAMAANYNRSHDLIHVQIRPDDAPATWTPEHRFNLTGNRTIPVTTYAKFLVDTATSLGQGGDKGFFKSQAQTHIDADVGVPLDIRTLVIGPQRLNCSTATNWSRSLNRWGVAIPPRRGRSNTSQIASSPSLTNNRRRSRDHRQLSPVLPDARSCRNLLFA